MTVPGTALDERVASVRQRFENKYWPKLAALPPVQALVVLICALTIIFLLGYIACQLLGKAMGAGEMTIIAGMIAGLYATQKFQHDKQRETDWDYVAQKGKADALVAHYTSAPPPAAPPTVVVQPPVTVNAPTN